ncbi:hypothetical protein GCM10027187_08520 [Streptosporangium sandarakinum]|uniref:Lipoprotein n=1 Tax=Streptosporangium sandarakinum TaxID=1260955 RepID=A0A852V7W4_9ACTN|nr:hypothetical protein [Streptosporangium sandarakinum]NYF42155.1 hypothetical protein [Streptosporangium sandarakinum]
MERRLRVFAVLTALAMIGWLSGCAKESPMDDGPDITEAQATARAEDLIHTVLVGVTPAPGMDLISTSPGSQTCLPDEGNTPTGKVYVIRKYYLTGIPKDRIVEAARQIQANWKKAGHRITNEYAFDMGEPQLSGRTGDDFRLALDTVERDSTPQILLSVGSPCFRPDKPSPSSSL